jgi:hypothetical protein
LYNYFRKRKRKKNERPEEGGGGKMKKKIEEGGAVGMDIQTPGGLVRVRSFSAAEGEGMLDDGGAIVPARYYVVINPDTYEYEAEIERPVGVEFVRKAIAMGVVKNG